MHSQSLSESLLIVVVIYKKDVNAVVQSITAWSDNAVIYVYDNSPAPSNALQYQVIYQHDPENGGVSKAYNEAFILAKKLGKKWILLLDQDTIISNDFLRIAKNAIDTNPTLQVFCPIIKDRKGIVSPYTLFLGKGVRVRALKPGKYSLSEFKIINSGALVTVNAFEVAGGYDERFPLDFSDVVFLHRLKKSLGEFFVMDVACNHELATTQPDRNASDALRRFITLKNSVYLYRKENNYLTIPAFVLWPVSIKLTFRYRSTSFLKELIK